MVPVASRSVAWKGDVHADPERKQCVPNLEEKRLLQNLGVQHPRHGTVQDVSQGGFSKIAGVEEETFVGLLQRPGGVRECSLGHLHVHEESRICIVHGLVHAEDLPNARILKIPITH